MWEIRATCRRAATHEFGRNQPGTKSPRLSAAVPLALNTPTSKLTHSGYIENPRLNRRAVKSFDFRRAPKVLTTSATSFETASSSSTDLNQLRELRWVFMISATR